MSTTSAPPQDKSLDEPHTLTFTKGELLVIFNVLTHSTYTIANAFLVKPVVDKIEPIVVAAGEVIGKREVRKVEV